MLVDSTKNDISKSSQKTDSTKSLVFKPNPRKAALLSMACPGLGQAYNRKYWKVPIVAAAVGTVGYLMYINLTGYNSVKNGISRLEDNDPSNDNQPIIVRDFDLKKYDLSKTNSLSDLLTIKKYFRQNLDLCFLSAAIIYVLNIVDANVDAHLYGFNVNDNIAVAPIYNQNGLGVAMQFK